MIRTFQDFEESTDKAKFVLDAINIYKQSEEYRLALIADDYDAQRNTTISEIVPKLFTVSGVQVEDFTASNNKLASNFFNRLNEQRCMYSLGNGVSFIDPEEAAKGQADTTKEMLGIHFDSDIIEAGHYALIHGKCYLFRDLDRCHVFKLTEFVPLDDEWDGSLRAGIRFWQLDSTKPLNAVLYEADGYTTYQTVDGKMAEVKGKTAYKVTYQYTDSDDEAVVIDEENYPALPVVRMYGTRHHQSTLVGMREAIDAYDLIKSGFANDMTDCAQIYWIVENFGGMSDNDLRQFLDRLKLNHVANANTQNGGKVAPYTQEVPYQSREAILQRLRNDLYEDFSVLDVHTVAAGATNDHIDMGYQTMDNKAAEFERLVSEAIMGILALEGIEDVPQFRRNKISNQPEQVDMVVKESLWLDKGTILRKLPNLTPEDVQAVLIADDESDMGRMGITQTMGDNQ